MAEAWLAIAKKLAYGQSRKIECCGKGRTTYVSNSPAGYRVGPCFRCGATDFVKAGPRTLAEIAEARRRVEEVRAMRAMPSTALPMADAPSDALQFILKAFITPERATNEYGFRYDPNSGRVLMPVDGGFLARRIHGDGPKYILSAPETTDHVYLSAGTPDDVAVVEDLLSAIRIKEAGMDAFTILGTSVTRSVAARIGTYPRVHGWFDPDVAGDRAFLRLRKSLALYPSRLLKHRTAKDPKHHFKSQIRKELGLA